MNDTNQLMNEILDLGNISLAVQRVKSNKGGAGIDGMKTNELDKYVNSADFKLNLTQIREGKYKPSPVKMVEIPKPDGGVRILGIPTVKDRVIQQAISQVLTKIYDSQFSEYNYGFRPNIGAHDAIMQAEKYVVSGSIYIVDIDLSKFFDTINRDKLMSLLKRQINEYKVLRLINRYLFAGMMSGATYIETGYGTPQGSPLSPLLSNIYLNELDNELTRRKIKFVRYADDIQIYCQSIRSAYRVLENTTKLIESSRFQLKVNRDKSAVKQLSESKFLGFTFWRDFEGDIKVIVHKKSVKRFKDKVRMILKRNRGISIEQFIKELNQVTTGWMNYYKIGLSRNRTNKFDMWIRDKLRTILWKHWKTSKMRRRMQRKYSIRKDIRRGNSRKGMYAVATHELHFTLRNIVLEEVYKYKPLIKVLEKESKLTRHSQLTLF